MENTSKIIEYLSDLININTTRDVKNEIAAARYLKIIFDNHNIEAAIYESFPGRGSVFAQIPGKSEEKIVIHTHLDTENYMEKDWSFPANQATISEKAIGGRGALDCKGLIAVWLQVFIDLYEEYGQPDKTVAFVSVAGEEDGGMSGTGWLFEHTNCFCNVSLVLGEGGGYPVPCDNKIYFTLQTGEVVDSTEDIIYTEDEIRSTMKLALSKGFYNQRTLDYYYDEKKYASFRRVEQESFYNGVKKSIARSRGTKVLDRYFTLIEDILQGMDKNFYLLPTFSPGYSDNRFFRNRGIDTLGFFPLDINNPIRGIHGINEYITKESLDFSYDVLKKLLKNIAYESAVR